MNKNLKKIFLLLNIIWIFFFSNYFLVLKANTIVPWTIQIDNKNLWVRSFCAEDSWTNYNRRWRGTCTWTWCTPPCLSSSSICTRYRNINNDRNSSPFWSFGSFYVFESSHICNVRFRWTQWDVNSYNCWSTCTTGTCVPTHIRPNRITSFDQLGYVDYNYNWTSSLSNQCSIEARVAVRDNDWPQISISPQAISDFFNSESDNFWCNVESYIDTWDWCDDIIALTGVNKPDDLLKWLTITLSDQSWIYNANINLWEHCSAEYRTLTSVFNLSEIINSTTSNNWVKTEYTSRTITYDELIDLFQVDRLDECFWEWKNGLHIVSRDMAISSSNFELSSNSSTFQSTWTINNDSSFPKIELLEDLLNVHIYEDYFLWREGFYNYELYNIDEDWKIWRNFTIEWNIQVVEDNQPSSPECDEVILTCTSTEPIPPWQVWISPIWVNPDTWEFTQYQCEWMAPFPDISECALSSLPDEDKCTIWVWWNELEIEDWEEEFWVFISPDECYAYCIPWHSVWCIIKETPEDWVCWSSDGQTFTDEPNENLCSSWNPTDVLLWDWVWNWSCNWTWWWEDSELCTATKQEDPEENWCILDATIECMVY